MIAPQHATVRPRVFRGTSAEARPLEQSIHDLLASGVRGVVRLAGPAGSGKTTALRHLAAVLPPAAPVLLLDEDEPTPVLGDEPEQLVLQAEVSSSGVPRSRVCRLARWTDDDLIEYLLAVHHDRCADVFARLPDRDWLAGIPQLCTIALDVLASDASTGGARAAVRHHLGTLLREGRLLDDARSACLDALTEGGLNVLRPDADFVQAAFPAEAVRLFRHAQVQLLLGAERISEDLRSRADCDHLALRLPRPLIEAAAANLADELSHDPQLAHYLVDLVEGDAWSHAMAASLLHAARPGWCPRAGRQYLLTGAYLAGARWSGLDLSGISHFREADLSGADLSGAALDRVNLGRSSLRSAILRHASLNELRAVEADLTGADLSHASGDHTHWDGARLSGAALAGAKLSDATFRAADLTNARLNHAILFRADFAGAQLVNASFRGALLVGAHFSKLRLRDADLSESCLMDADLSGCDMEEMELAGLDCRAARLRGTYLTGANLSGADLTRAILRGAALGDINLQGACLRDADLTHATFHMGSSRSGLVSSPIAGEGSRTGFYTDEADEQTFKAPEEIRKANLCGADLRGASVEEADFYLVDLRGALYDDQQERHFRQCRAIL